MKTTIFSTVEKDLRKAGEILENGGLVAFPTETVYGLGANAFDKKAVKKIFKAKGRPQDNPLIVHISELEQLKKIAKNVPKDAFILAEKFWPGPLTIVLKKRKNIPENVSAGLDSVAIRMPSNNIARKVISFSNPLAAPSANLSGRPSPTTAEHVIEDLNNRIDGIIEGRRCLHGVESTVVDLTQKPFVLLRPGAVTFEQLERVLGKGKIVYRNGENNNGESNKGEKVVRSPGMKYKHYSPKAKVILIEKDFKEKSKEFVNKNNKKTYFIHNKNNLKLKSNLKEKSNLKGKSNLEVKNNSKLKFENEIIYNGKKDLAKNIFYWFRMLDEKGAKKIIVQGVDERGIGMAIMNRLRKASQNK